jgi:hypothetical protein
MSQCSYAVEDVREIAAHYNYNEIGYNEGSRVISFRKEKTRINVYYTTGTVGTCMDHPTKGKTQLFRRMVLTIAELENIFENPRIHTGTGYYRKKLSQYWKAIDQYGQQSFEVDSVRRWKYVASAAGLSNDQNEISNIAKFCTSWDLLYWNYGDLPRLSNIKYTCGAQAAMVNMVLETVGDLLGYPVKIVCKDENEREIYPDAHCCNMERFLDSHQGDVYDIQNQLMNFRKDIQIELAQWFVSRDWCGYFLTDHSNHEIKTKYSVAVNNAHFHYAEMAYTKKQRSCMCPLHGVLYDPHPDSN